MNKKTLGIVGCGNIGAALVRFAKDELAGRISNVVVFDTDKSKIDAIEKEITVAAGIEELVAASDLIVEAVSPAVAGTLLEEAVENAKDILIMSVGGVLGKEDVLKKAETKGSQVIFPSGAIAGIDALKAAKIAGVEAVTITTRKPPLSLKGADYLLENGIDVEVIKEETVIFEGNAASAIKAFPKNINVSVLLSLAGIGPENTKVRIVVSPEFTKNSHEVEIIGKAGTIVTKTSNVPSPLNPKTSYMAVLSAIATLKEYFSVVKIGT